jgi:transcriptional regulator with XRE-family HTH domain
MEDTERDRLLAAVLESPAERNQLLESADLSASERTEFLALVETADAVWLAAHGAPALEDDPIAAMLGLVPDSQCRLSRGALASERKKQRLTVDDLANRLSRRGWDVSQRDVFQWETRSTEQVPPALVQAIAEILRTDVSRIIDTGRAPAQDSLVTRLRGNETFRDLAQRWATIRRVSLEVALASLEQRALATVHRGSEPDVQQLLGSLEALVSALEDNA